MNSFMPFQPHDPSHHLAAAALWTRACGKDFALSSRALAHNLLPPLDAEQSAQFALVAGERAGFVLASILHRHPDVAPPALGWIDALVVAPEFQKRGVGGALLAWAEDWLRAQGRTLIRLGGGLRPFAPGVPTALNVNFFRERGYVPRAENPIVRDFGCDLRAYHSPSFPRLSGVECRPAQVQDIAELQKFLAREFPGRWQYEFDQHLRDGGRLSDYMILKTESRATKNQEPTRGIDACCIMTFEDSLNPIERYYPAPLPRPWGQVGAIGVRADRRSMRYGSTLLDAALNQLQARGVRGCIIDWTHHIGYYERFGFRAQRAYEVLVKQTA